MTKLSLAELQNLMGDLLETLGEDAAFEVAKAQLNAGSLIVWPNPALYAYLNKTRQYSVIRQIYDTGVLQNAYPPAGVRDLLAAGIARDRPSVIVASLPKSGTVYLGGQLARVLETSHVPASPGRFPNNIVFPEVLKLLARGGGLSIDHFDASPRNLAQFAAAGLQRIAVQIRDPRQGAVSWFHYVDRVQTGHRRGDRHSTDPALPDDFDSWPEADRLQWHCENYFPNALRWISQWLAVAEHDPRFEIIVSEYQDLRRDAGKVVQRICSHFGIDLQVAEGDFPAPSADENFRAGLLDEWRQVIPAATLQWMNAMMPEALCRRFDWDRT